MEAKKILIIKPSSFGDIVQASPVVPALKKAFPGCHVTWLVFDCWADIVSLFPGVDRIGTWKRKGGIRHFLRVIRNVRREKYDLVVDLQGLARSALLAFFSGAKKTVGVPGMKEGSGWLVKEPFPESRSLNAVERSLETIRYLTGEKTVPVFEIAVPPADEEQALALLDRHGIRSGDTIVGIVPSARGAAKQWPVMHYDDLIGRVSYLYPQVKTVLLGAETDFGLVGHSCAVDLCGQTTMRQLAAVFSRCRAVIGGDTGPVHLASAMGVPVIMFFGGSDIRETAPVSPKAVLLSKNLSCSPCRGRPSCRNFPCLTEITPGEVFEILQEMLSETEKDAGRAQKHSARDNG